MNNVEMIYDVWTLDNDYIGECEATSEDEAWQKAYSMIEGTRFLAEDLTVELHEVEDDELDDLYDSVMGNVDF